MQLIGAGLIARERERQIAEEDYDAEHDDQLKDGQLAIAGAAYALAEFKGMAEGLWPFGKYTFKPKNRLRNLVRAGALIAAEIDRLQRLPTPVGD